MLLGVKLLQELYSVFCHVNRAEFSQPARSDPDAINALSRGQVERVDYIDVVDGFLPDLLNGVVYTCVDSLLVQTVGAALD